ncbi:MAG TPA: primosomal protein N', partial [Pseudorhizobium sp.]|nr:primosomal protein N' [Pseudorhizobium sp.]
MLPDSSNLFGALFDAPPVGHVVPVLVPLPAPGPYSYAVPEGMHVEPGSVVQVPLGPRQVIGVVWDGDNDEKLDPKKLRPITLVFDCPPLSTDMRRFLDWVANYTLSPPGLVARMAIRAPAALEPEPMIEGIRYVGGQPERMTPARSRVLERVDENEAWTRAGLARAAGVSTTVVDGL